MPLSYKWYALAARQATRAQPKNDGEIARQSVAHRIAEPFRLRLRLDGCYVPTAGGA